MLSARKAASDIVQQGDRLFRWRGGEVSRLESLFDAVIALALTLIVVSIEVPSSFDALLDSFYKLPAFAVCFAILLMCWYYHFLFHRRYGIEDFPIVVLNGILMFLVVFYVYPLKFLYTLMFAQRGEINITAEQIPLLMIMYSGGFVAIFILMFLMYGYAYLKREGLNLNANEVALTRLKLGEHGCYIAIGIVSIVLATLPDMSPIAGLVYCAIAPMQFFNGLFWGRYVDGAQPDEDDASNGE